MYRIYEVPVSKEEKAVGIVEKSSNEGILLRNCLTFVLRQAIADAERDCYYASCDSLRTIRRSFRKLLQKEVFLASLRGKNQNKDDLVGKAIMHNSVVCDKTDDGGYRIKDHLFFSDP